MAGIWKTALVASALALVVVAVLLWLLFPLSSNTATGDAARSAPDMPSNDYLAGDMAVPGTNVLISETGPNVHIGNDGLIFELSAAKPAGSATIDFTDRSGLIDPFFTKSTVAFRLRPCVDQDRPSGTVHIQVQPADRPGREPTLFVLNEARPSTGLDAIRYLWRPIEVAVTLERGGVALPPVCAVLVAILDTPRSFQTAPPR